MKSPPTIAVAKGDTLLIVLPVKTRNPLNLPQGNTRTAGIIRAAERAKHRATARLLTLAAFGRFRVSRAALIPALVTITRVSAGHMDDEGLMASQKGIRDGVADALGVDDGGPFVRFAYRQRKGPQRAHSVEVRIEKDETPGGAT